MIIAHDPPLGNEGNAPLSDSHLQPLLCETGPAGKPDSWLLPYISAAVSTMAFCVYCFIYGHADLAGRCYPSQRRMRRYMRLAFSSITKSLEELESLQLLDIERSHGRPNIYQLYVLHVRQERSTAQGGVLQYPSASVRPDGTEHLRNTKRKNTTNSIGDVWPEL